VLLCIGVRHQPARRESEPIIPVQTGRN